MPTATLLPLKAKVSSTVQWFASSRRLVAGKSDTHYGWWAAPPDGKGPAVVKALDASLTAAADSLLSHERLMLTKLQEAGAPIPEPLWPEMAERPDWVVTRMSGLSMRTLLARSQQGLPSLSLPERLSVWAHLARRLHPVVKQNAVLMVDLWSANVLVPLTQQTQGQLQLNRPVVVDHAHTLFAATGMRRPLWIDETQDRIAPELADALRADRQALESHFQSQGASLPGYSRLPTELDQRSRQAWAEYDAPSALQSLLDSGALDADAAMQYALGSALRHEVAHATNEQQALVDMKALARLVDCLCSPEPKLRLQSLDAAATALGQVVGSLHQASSAHLEINAPIDLMLDTVSAEPQTDGTAATGTAMKAETPHLETGTSDVGTSPYQLPLWPWVATGAAMGTLLFGLLH